MPRGQFWLSPTTTGSSSSSSSSSTHAGDEYFVFLGVYRAVRLIATLDRAVVVTVLCAAYRGEESSSDSGVNSSPGPGIIISLRSRALVAQALCEVLRHGGPLSVVSQASLLQAVVAAAVSVVRKLRLSHMRRQLRGRRRGFDE